ncbi:hypothetical protein HK105_206324, partial [Polyrhizophydium stewartii]
MLQPLQPPSAAHGPALGPPQLAPSPSDDVLCSVAVHIEFPQSPKSDVDTNTDNETDAKDRMLDKLPVPRRLLSL